MTGNTNYELTLKHKCHKIILTIGDYSYHGDMQLMTLSKMSCNADAINCFSNS